MTGYPWNRGDTLRAEDLNAAVASGGLESRGLYVTAMPEGDVWLTVNAKWDGTHWQRIHTGSYAYAIVFQAFSNIPGEAVFNSALMLLRATPAANPLGPFWSVGGWENMAIFDQFRHIVVGGFGIEVDGSGTFPYARFAHAGASGVVRSGTLTNMFIDFIGVDDNTQPSWFIGRRDDAVVIERAPAGATTTAGFASLMLVDQFGNLAIANNLTVPGQNAVFSGLKNAASDVAAAAAGVPMNGLYHNAGAVRVRIT